MKYLIKITSKKAFKVFGIILLLYLATNYSLGFYSLFWPEARGKFNKYNIKYFEDYDESNSNGKYNDWNHKYEYIVNNKMYESSRVSFPNIKLNYFDSQKEYIEIYYCPIIPNISVIYPGVYMGVKDVLFIILFGIWILFVLASYIVVVKTEKE